jgi:hypothetical protein
MIEVWLRLKRKAVVRQSRVRTRRKERCQGRRRRLDLESASEVWKVNDDDDDDEDEEDNNRPTWPQLCHYHNHSASSSLPLP